VTIDQLSFTVHEGEDVTIQVNITSPLAVPIDVKILDDPLTEIRIPIGSIRAIIDFRVPDNNMCGDNMTLNLNIVPLTANCVAGNPGRATLTILDDDGR